MFNGFLLDLDQDPYHDTDPVQLFIRIRIQRNYTDPAYPDLQHYSALLTISGYRIPMLLCRDEVDSRFLPQILTIIWYLECCCGFGAELFGLEVEPKFFGRSDSFTF